MNNNNISPLDNRYRLSCSKARSSFSEEAIMRFRVYFEKRWFLRMHSLNCYPAVKFDLNEYPGAVEDWLYSPVDCDRIRQLESTLNHDVKAVEMYVKETLPETLAPHKNLVHIFLTSEDVCNASLNLAIRSFQVGWTGDLIKLRDALQNFVKDSVAHNHLMVSKTHGQVASPTTFGKEMAVYAHRLDLYGSRMNNFRPSIKISGAVGNFNAHQFVLPSVDWVEFSKVFATTFDGSSALYSTQVDPKDNIIEYLDGCRNYCSLMLNLCRNMWMYCADGTLKIVAKKGEVGSSTMPHKVNPIKFENAEGNFHVAKSLITAISDKIFESRYQRDLSDSSVLRNMGVALGHMELATNSLIAGLGLVEFDKKHNDEVLASSSELLLEPIQQLFRWYGVDVASNFYEQFRGVKNPDPEVIKKSINKEVIAAPAALICQLERLGLDNYYGYAHTLSNMKLRSW